MAPGFDPGQDVRIVIVGSREIYHSGRPGKAAERRRVILEDEAGTWRLTGEWRLHSAQPLELAPRSD